MYDLNKMYMNTHGNNVLLSVLLQQQMDNVIKQTVIC